MPFIAKIGYTKFHKFYDSDRRGIYCDISNNIFEKVIRNDNIPRKRLVGTNSKNHEGTEFFKYTNTW
jgi:hypothetical protein